MDVLKYDNMLMLTEVGKQTRAEETICVFIMKFHHN